MKKIITIDGPSASGKSTVSRELSLLLGWPWISTGAFYRGLAYVALQKAVDLKDEIQILPLIDDSSWSVLMEPEATRVIFKAHDVSEAIKGEKVGAVASKISQFGNLRKSLLERQRRCFDPKEGLIAEGRDCGTVVFPEAFLKIYLTADAERRAQRRSVEESKDVGSILEQQKKERSSR